MSDHDAVARLVLRYAQLLDGGDLDGVAALFERATWRSGSGVRTGAAEARSAYDNVVLYDGIPRTKHVITNLDIEVDGDTARASSYFTVMQAAPDFPLQPIIAGRYLDTFARDDSGWYFTDREIIPDLWGDTSRHYPSR